MKKVSEYLKILLADIWLDMTGRLSIGGVFIRSKIRVSHTLVTISEKSGLNLPCHKFSCNKKLEGDYFV